MDTADDKRAIALSFLQTVLPHEGTYFVTRKTRAGAVIRDAVATFDGIIDKIFDYAYDAWFSTASFNDATKSNADNVKLLRAFRVDVDCGFEKPYDSQQEGMQALLQFVSSAGLPRPGVVNSGNGLHLWWALKDPITKPVWERYAKGLKRAVVTHGFQADAASIADSARILRLPGTYNFKDKECPKEVREEAQFFERGPYDLQEFACLLPNGEDKTERMEKLDFSGVALTQDTYKQYSSMIDGIPDWDDRAQWFKVGCAIKRLNWGNDGYKLWESWSKKSSKFDAEDQLKTWNSISDDYGGDIITPGSLSYLSTLSTLSTGTKQEYKQKLDGEDADWHSVRPTWQKTASGHMKENNYINAVLAIEKLGIGCRHNEITKTIEVKLENDWDWEKIGDAVIMRVRDLTVGGLHSDPGLLHVRNALRALGHKSNFNPVVEYLDASRWDGVERIKTWLSDCLGAEDTEANRFFGQLILLAAIRRVRKPGTKFDHMLVLEGPHGIGKSTVVQILGLRGILGNGYYAHTTFDRDIHRFIESIKGAWFVEWDELNGIKSGLYWEHIKSCISQTVDQARLAYGLEVNQYDRLCIFIGTTNESIYIPNKAGNRRFWPVQLKKRIDLANFRAVVPQLYAEANIKEKGYFDINVVPRKLEDDISRLQLSRTTEPALFDYLVDASGREAKGIEFISNKDIKAFLGLAPKDVLSRGFNSQDIKSAMETLGWERASRTIDSKTYRGYERLKKAPDDRSDDA